MAIVEPSNKLLSESLRPFLVGLTRVWLKLTFRFAWLHSTFNFSPKGEGSLYHPVKIIFTLNEKQISQNIPLFVLSFAKQYGLEFKELPLKKSWHAHLSFSGQKGILEVTWKEKNKQLSFESRVNRWAPWCDEAVDYLLNILGENAQERLTMQLTYEKLNEDQIHQKLIGLRGWKLDAGMLTKTYTFSSYPAGLVFASAVGQIAEQLNHHPDLFIGYQKVSVSLITHDAGGLTSYDFELAKRIEGLIS